MNIVIVLGKRLRDDGSMTPELLKRLDKGAQTFRDTGADRICVTGGRANRNAPCAEAERMLPYLEEKGIPREKILAETRSRTTLGNALYTRRLLKGKQVSKIWLVSSRYHFSRFPLKRAHWLFRAAFPFCEIIRVIS